MKLIVGKQEYGKPKKFILIAETDFEKSFLQEEIPKNEDFGLRPAWGYENKLELEFCKVVKLSQDESKTG